MSEYFLFWLAHIFAVFMFGVVIVGCVLFIILLVHVYKSIKKENK